MGDACGESIGEESVTSFRIDRTPRREILPFSPAGFSGKKQIVRAACYRLTQMRRNCILRVCYSLVISVASTTCAASISLPYFRSFVPSLLFNRRRVLFDADQDSFRKINASFLFLFERFLCDIYCDIYCSFICKCL